MVHIDILQLYDYQKSFFPYLCSMTAQETIIRNLARLLTLPQLREQALDVLVYGTCPDALTLTPEQELQLKVQMGKYLRQHMQLNQDLGTIFTYLKENGLHPVLLKGQGSATYYPNPILRATGDLDIWVGETDYEKAKQLMRDFGCQEGDHETPMHASFYLKKTSIEIHRIAQRQFHPLHHRYYKELSAQQLEKPDVACIGGQDIQIPPSSFNAFHTFMHL